MVRRLLISLSLMLSLVVPAMAAFPTVTDFAPKKGPPGTTVQIVGFNFAGLTEVDFFNGASGAQATIVGFDGSSSIFVLVPPDAQNGPITVVTQFGSGSSRDFFQPAPVIRDFYTQLNPSTFEPVTPVRGTAGQTLTIRGLNFNDSTVKSSVFVGGVQIANPSIVADNQITLTLPQGAQTGQVIVTNSAGAATNDSVFSGGYIYFNPLVTQFTSSAATGATIDIFGQSLLGVTDVRFGSVAAQFTVVSGTNIQAVVPATAVDGTLTVTSPGGSFITSSNFLVGPSIVSFSPVGGPVGTVVTITGTGLSNTKTVLFGGVPATTGTNINATTVTAVVPNNTFTAPLTVITGNGTNVSATPFYLPPRVDGFDPASGLVGTVVTLNGVNFTGTTKVELAGQSIAGFMVTGTNKITLTVPDGAVSGVFRVTNPGGADESAVGFAVVAPTPSISGFTPTGGPVGSQVTISGLNLANATKVEFNGLNASFTVNGASLVATVPAGATTGPIQVTNPAGQGTSGSNFTVASNADLKVTLTPSLNPAIAYGLLGYSMQVNNRGPLAVSDAQLVLTLPSGVTFDSVAGSQNFEVLGSKVSFPIGNMALNGNFNVTVLVRVGAPTTLTASAQVSSSTQDDVPANNTATAVVSAQLPALSLDRLDVGSIFLQWPSPATNFVLESTLQLQVSPTWQTVTNSPDDDGVTRQLILPASNPATFFRLRLNQ